MDRTDKKILNKLLKDPKKSFAKIAKEIGVSPSTIIKRYEKFIKDSLITGTFTILDLSKIDFQGKAFLFLSVKKGYSSEKTINFLRRIPNIFLIFEIIGGFDLLIMMVFRDFSEILNLVKKIKKFDYIKRVEMSITGDVFYPVREEYTEISL